VNWGSWSESRGSTYTRAQIQCAEVAYAGVQVRYTGSRVGQRAVVKVVKWRWALAEVCSVPAAEEGGWITSATYVEWRRLAAGFCI